MKILWAYDPFEKNKQLRFFGKKLLLKLFSSTDSIKAIYVASHLENKLNMALNIPKKNRYTTYPKKLMRIQLNKINLKNITLKVLPELSTSLNTSVRKLASYALSSDSDLIVIPTHSKSGLNRFVFGSFAESLIHVSETDLLLYNQKTKLRKTPKKLVYAHDFSSKGSDGLLKLIDYAKKWNASITVVHIPGLSYSARGFDEELKSYREYIHSVAAHIKELLEKKNIECTVIIETNPDKLDADVILNVTKRLNADIVAVTAKTGKMAALMGGSVTRSIIRKSVTPTLVLKV